MSVTGYEATISKKESEATKNTVNENIDAITKGVDAIFDVLPPEVTRPGVSVLLNGTHYVIDFYDGDVKVKATALNEAFDDRAQAVSTATKALENGDEVYRSHRNTIKVAGGDEWLALFGLTHQPDSDQSRFLAQMKFALGRYKKLGQDALESKTGTTEVKLDRMITEMETAITDIETKQKAVGSAHAAIDARRGDLEKTAKRARQVRRGIKWILRGLILLAGLEHLIASLNPRKKPKSPKAKAAGLKAAETRKANKYAKAKVVVEETEGRTAPPPADPPPADGGEGPLDVDPSTVEPL